MMNIFHWIPSAGGSTAKAMILFEGNLRSPQLMVNPFNFWRWNSRCWAVCIYRSTRCMARDVGEYKRFLNRGYKDVSFSISVAHDFELDNKKIVRGFQYLWTFWMSHIDMKWFWRKHPWESEVNLMGRYVAMPARQCWPWNFHRFFIETHPQNNSSSEKAGSNWSVLSNVFKCSKRITESNIHNPFKFGTAIVTSHTFLKTYP